MKWRVAETGIFSLAIHRLSEVSANVDRLASKWGVHAVNNALEIIWNAYRMIVAGIGRPKSRDFVYF
jgi:hypothetical protein